MADASKDPRLSYIVDTENYINTDLGDLEDLQNEMLEGKGYVFIPQMFSKEDIAHAKELLMYLVKKEGPKATHFHGSDDSKANLQARTWNLLDKGQIWEKFVQHPKLMALVEPILGDDFQLGSIAANTLFPGATGQEPHIDYPYWDYYEKKHWPATPKVAEVPFHMNLQITILLDDFTVENGATAVKPGTQKVCVYPDSKEFYKDYVQATGKAGDVMVFLGLIQHCASPNKSQQSRSGILIQHLPKFVRPMEDIKASVKPEVLERASPRMRRLLCLDYPYPAVMDREPIGNTEGSKSDFKWKEY